MSALSLAFLLVICLYQNHDGYHCLFSKETPSHFQESTYQTPPARRAIAATPMQSYVTYPNDPTAYYTLNGEHRLSANPPPSYYRHH